MQIKMRSVKLARRVLSLLALSFCIAFAQENPADNAFSSLYVSIEGGEAYPFGSLVDAVENAYYAGARVRYSYWANVDGIVQFSYSYFKPVSDDVVGDGAHQFSGAVGLDWKWNLIRPVRLGAGFICDWVRSDAEDYGNYGAAYREPGGTLLDNETEFGWFAHINIPCVNWKNFIFGLNLQWEELWTEPDRSDMLTTGLYVERKLW